MEVSQEIDRYHFKMADFLVLASKFQKQNVMCYQRFYQNIFNVLVLPIYYYQGQTELVFRELYFIVLFTYLFVKWPPFSNLSPF